MNVKNIQISQKQLTLNSFAFILVYFLYSIVVFPGLFIGQGPATILLTLAVMFPIIAFNLLKGFMGNTRRACVFEFLVLTLLILEIAIYPEYIDAILETIRSVLTIGTIGLIVATFKIDSQQCYKYGNYFAIAAFLSSIMLPFTMTSEDIFDASMRFAYAILPSVMWALLMFLRTKSFKYLLAFIVSYAPLLIWGSRGATICVLLFLLLYILRNKPKLLILLIPLAFLFFLNIQQTLVDFFTWIEEVTGSEKIGSFVKLVTGGEEARDKIYDYCWLKISQNFLGSGVGWWMYDPNMYGLYPHNVVLHIGTEFGVLGILFLFIVCVAGLRNVFTTSKEDSLLYMYFFAIGIGRLMVSSVYWDRPEFWFLIGISFFRRKL